MEARDTPTPPADPPPPPPDAPQMGRPSRVMRLFVLILAMLLLVAGFFMGVFAIAAADAVDCNNQAEVAKAILEDGEDATCYESATLRVAMVGLGWLSAGLCGLGMLLALAFAITTRFGSAALRVSIAAVTSGALALLAALID